MNHPTPSRNASARTTASLIVASAILALLLISEVSGLASETLGWASTLVLAATALLLAVAGRSGQEAAVFGLAPVVVAGSAGWTAGCFIFALLLPFLTSGIGEIMLAAALAGVGAFSGYLIARRWRAAGEQPRVNPLIGVFLALTGGAVLVVAYPMALGELSLLLGRPDRALAAFILFLCLVTLTFGGWRGVLVLGGALAAIILASSAGSVFLGIQQIGPPPVTPFIDTPVLEQITALREAFALKSLPFPEVGTLRNSTGGWLGGLALFFVAGVGSGLFMRSAIDPQPISFGLNVSLSIAVLGGFSIAIGGYALEAAGQEFFISPVSQPAPGLLAAARQGLIAICGAQPITEDQLLAACQATPLSRTVLSVGQVRFDPAFLPFGLAHALGTGVIGSLLANLWKPLLSVMLVLGGLLLMITGLGHHVFGYRYRKPGLASFRIALLRVATVLVLGIMAWLLPKLTMLQPDHVWRAAAVILMLASALSVWAVAAMTARAPLPTLPEDARPTRPQRPDSREGTPEA